MHLDRSNPIASFPSPVHQRECESDACPAQRLGQYFPSSLINICLGIIRAEEEQEDEGQFGQIHSINLF